MNRPREHSPEVILAAAVSVFRDNGVQVSTAKVAEAAGVSNGTLFNYFPTKQHLIDALYLSLKTDLGVASGETDRVDPIETRIRLVWDRWLDWARCHRDEHMVMNLLRQSGLASADAQAAGAEAVTAPALVLAEAQAAGLLVGLPLDYLAALIQQQLDQAVSADLDDQQAELAFQVLWNGITQQPDRQEPPRSTAP